MTTRCFAGIPAPGSSPEIIWLRATKRSWNRRSSEPASAFVAAIYLQLARVSGTARARNARIEREKFYSDDTRIKIALFFQKGKHRLARDFATPSDCDVRIP